MSQEFCIEQFDNGLTLVAQPMGGMSSAAVTLDLPAGVSFDAEGAEGSAAVLTEWVMRGAGDMNTRQLNDALASLGCQHHQSAQSRHIAFSMAHLGRNLGDSLGILGDMVRRPMLGDDTFEACRALVQQDLACLEDEPAHKANKLLREKYFPHPLGRCELGNEASLKALTPEAVRKHASCFGPNEAILAVAGHFDWDQLRDMVGAQFGDWQKQQVPKVELTPPAGGFTHIEKDSAQVHITLAYPSVFASDEQYYAARVAVTVLSGGMSSRLFTEVREKRALVYHVSTCYSSLKDIAGLFTYAGTVPEKVQETFDVTVGELKRLGEGVTDEELARAKTQLKSAMVMQGESTIARSAALATDWYFLGELRDLGEMTEAVNAVTKDDVMRYLCDWPAENFTVLLIGPESVDTSAVNL